MGLKDDIIACAIIAVIIGVIIFAFAYGASFVATVTFHGQRYEVTITVQAVEYSTRFGEHTNVWAKVYGEQDITYRFFGRVEVEIGKTYRIIFVDSMYFTIYGFEVRGTVIDIEVVAEGE